MLVLLTGHQKIILNKIYLSNTKHDVKTSKKRFCQFCSGSVCLKQFSKNIFMSVRPIVVQTKVHFKSLKLLVVTFDMGR